MPAEEARQLAAPHIVLKTAGEPTAVPEVTRTRQDPWDGDGMRRYLRGERSKRSSVTLFAPSHRR
eukprot:738101-Pyramimonas_sp.AAC.1